MAQEAHNKVILKTLCKQDMVLWRAVVNTVMNLQVIYGGEFLE
jgi:hypothetical protein